MSALAEPTEIDTCDFPLHRSAFARVVQRGQPPVRMHVLFALTARGMTAPFAPLIQFFRDEGPHRCLSRQREMTWAVGLLLDFLAASSQNLADVPTGTLFAFASALRTGTTPGGRLEQAGLRWPERSHDRAARCLALVSEFGDWLSNRTGDRSINGWRDATPAERLVLMRRAERRTAAAMLGHIAMQQRSADRQPMRTVRLRRKPNDAPGGTVYAFDEKHFERLIHRGFARNAAPGAALHRRLRLRDMMITLLLHGGGLRESEPFHLFVGDVDVDPERPGVARVRVYHPQDGAAPVEHERRWRDRAHYLRERWNLEPRSSTDGRYHAGWKDLALTDQRHRFAQVFWFPENWGRVFLRLYRAYLKVRPRANHPFLFVSERRDCRGDPYTLAAFEQAHARAVRRIGLVPEKHSGTTPHAHRHAYGRAMADAGLDRLYRQRALHHRSPESQEIYTLPDAAKVNAVLSEASARLWEGEPSKTWRELENDDED